MGLSSTTNRKVYTGDGSSTIFSFPFEFFSTSDLQVSLYDINSSIVTNQVLSTNYTVSGNVNLQGIYPNGGNVVMNSAFPSSLQIVITRAPIQTNTYVLNQNQPINSVAIGQQFDYLTALVQNLQDKVSRSVKIPDGLGLQAGSSFGVELPASIFSTAVSNYALTVNSGANGWALASVPGVGTIIPISQGGTGVNTVLPVGGIWYTLNATALAVSAAGTVNQVLQGNGSSGPTWGQVNLAGSSVTGTVPVAYGGTGTNTSYTQYGVIYASSATQFGTVPSGALGNVLIFQGSSQPLPGAIALTNVNSVSGILGVGNGGTGNGSFATATVVLGAGGASGLTTVGPGGADQALIGNGSGYPLFQALNLASGSSIKNTLSVANGGTGVTGLGVNSVLIGAGSSTISYSTAGSQGLALVSGAGAPVFGVLGVAGGGTGISTSYIQYGVVIASSATQLATTGAGVAGQVLTSNATSPPTFQSVSVVNSVNIISAGYNASTSDQFIQVSSSNFTINLYGASGNSGKTIRFKKTDTNMAVTSGVTIAGSNATIDGALSTTINTKNEALSLYCDGTNWQTFERRVDSTTGSSIVPVISGFGTVSGNTQFTRRVGDELVVQGSFTCGSGGFTQAQIQFGLLAGGDITADPNKLNINTLIGEYLVGTNTGNTYSILAPTGASSIVLMGVGAASSNRASATTGNQIASNGNNIQYYFSIPIQGWKG